MRILLVFLCAASVAAAQRTVTIRCPGADGAWLDLQDGTPVGAHVWAWTVDPTVLHTVTFWDPSPDVGTRRVVEIAGVEVPFRYCPPGVFTMGSPVGEVGRLGGEVQHQVTLTRGFWIGETEVTQRLYTAVTGQNPSYHRGEGFPVEEIAWADTQGFLAAVNAIDASLGARLPTEAEWEYACRAGTTTALHNGTDLASTIEDPNLDPIAWYGMVNPAGEVGNSGGQTHLVATRLANAWGIHDMLGNVHEWCSDFNGSHTANPRVDPTGPEIPVTGPGGDWRIYRGGSCDTLAEDCRSAMRFAGYPPLHYSDQGFRMVIAARVVAPTSDG